MAFQISLLIIIILLLIYIVYIQIRLTDRNRIIESIIEKLTGTESKLSNDELSRLISELPPANIKRVQPEDKLFDEKSMNFIFGNTAGSRVYIHYTGDEETAEKIIEEGFRFTDTFHRTALLVTNDRLDLMIKHNTRKFYGRYIIVITISDETVMRYTGELEKAGIVNYSFESILTEVPPQKNENSETVFILAPPFVKGYINYLTGEFRENPRFDPSYNSPQFSRNIKRIRESGF